MLRIILMASFFISSAMANNLKTIEDFHIQSAKLFKLAEKEKSHSDRAKYLEVLSESFEAEIAAYKKNFPNNGEKNEQDISMFFYTLDPVFEIAQMEKLTLVACAQKMQSVRTNDSMGRPENAPLTKNAKEALRWLELLCEDL